MRGARRWAAWDKGWRLALRSLAGLALVAGGALGPEGAASAADVVGLETVRFRQFGVDKGLSQATVRAIVQDRDGFIWMGTQEGLNRFDGYEFRTYLHSAGERPGLPDNHITALAVGPDQRLWVGTQNGGMALFDPYTGTARQWAPGDPGRGELGGTAVHALLAQRRGGLWVAAGTGQLQHLAEPSAPLRDVGGPSGVDLGQVRSLREAGDGAVLISSSTGVWRIANLEAPITLVADTPLDAQDVAPAGDGTLWVATDNDGVWRIDAEGHARPVLTRAEGLPDESPRRLLFDRLGRLWIGSLGGLSRWQVDRETLQVWRGDTSSEWDGLSAPRVEELYEDRNGLLWIGTWFNGANLHDPRTEAFGILRPAPGNPRSLPGRAVVDVLPGSGGSLWLTLNDLGALLHFDFERGLLARHHTPAASAVRTATSRARRATWGPEGVLWVSLGRGGLGQLKPGGQLELLAGQEARGLPEGDIYALHVDPSGTLWVGSDGGGLASQCRGCAGFTRFDGGPDDPLRLPSRDITALYSTRDGSLWIGTRHDGAVRLLADRSAAEHHPPERTDAKQIGHAYITSFLEDRDGVLWLGTQGAGVHRVQRDGSGRATGFERFDRTRGLAAEAVGAIQQDPDGQLWISTTAGLSRLDPATAQVINFSVLEGALSGGYFVGSSAKLEDGRLLFGGPRGLTVFDPRDVQPPPPPSRIAISAVRVLGGSGDKDGGLGMGTLLRDPEGDDLLTLAEGDDDFTLEMTALSYASPEQLLYEYRLEPFEPWRRVDARRRFASYSNVPAGDYRFFARALRPQGESGEMLSLRIRVPEVYRPWTQVGMLAIPASVLLCGLLLAMLLQRQRDRARSRQRVAESEARLKLALWGTGDELWDYDLPRSELRRENPLPHIRTAGDERPGGVAILNQYLHPDDVRTFQDSLDRVIDGRSEVLDVSVRAERVGGGYAWLRSRGRVAERDAQGSALRITGTTSDITELKDGAAALEEANRRLEQRVEERTAALSLANQDLADTLSNLRRAQRQLVEQEKMAALGGLVAGVAHEINTPIGIGVTAASHLETCTRDFLGRLAEGRLTRSELQLFSETAGESADLILRNLSRADKLIKSFKQVAVDQTNLDRRRINLAAYVGEILTAWNPRLRRSRPSVVCDIPSDIEIETQPGAIYQVLSNLIQNSLLHGFPEQESEARIVIRARVEGELLRLEFRDSGVGMEESVRRRVFEPFVTTRRGSGGSGLGLHIVYNLVTQALGGSIECLSRPGEGVCFVMQLPLVESGSEPGLGAAPAPSA